VVSQQFEDAQRAMSCQCLLQCCNAERDIHHFGEALGQNFAAEQVHDHHEIHEATAHRNISDICAPNLAGPINHDVPQQIGLSSPLKPIGFESRVFVAVYTRTKLVKTTRFSDAQIMAILKQAESGWKEKNQNRWLCLISPMKHGAWHMEQGLHRGCF
jgi:hypothetical protein